MKQKVDSGYVTSRLTGRKSYQYLLADPIGAAAAHGCDLSQQGCSRRDAVESLEGRHPISRAWADQ